MGLEAEEEEEVQEQKAEEAEAPKQLVCIFAHLTGIGRRCHQSRLGSTR